MTHDHVAVDVMAALHAGWGLRVEELLPLSGGMNSRTWSVRSAGAADGARHGVAKLVRSDQRDCFVRGLGAATLVEAAGLAAGAPLLTRDGADHVDLAGGALALLGWVDGDPLTGEQEWEQALIGAALGGAHRVLRDVVEDCSPDSALDFPAWVDPEADHLDVEGWVRPAVRSALAAHRALEDDPLGVGLLHADPEPGAFLRDPRTGSCAIVDWSSAEHGPLLYDLASALMYVGGPRRGRALLRAYAYADAVGVPAADLAAPVEVLLVLRQAVQADYFARRLAGGDLTGISGAQENWQGLHDARAFFAVDHDGGPRA